MRKIANLWILSVAISSVLPPQTNGGILHWFPQWNRARGVLLRQIWICCVQRPASSDDSPRGLPISGADHDIRPALPLVTPHPFIDEGPQTLSAAKAVAVASPSPTPSHRSMRPLRAHRDVPVRPAFSAIECTGRKEAKRLMTTTTIVDTRVSSRSERVSTGVSLPPRNAPSPSLYTTDDEVACLTGATEPPYVRPVPLYHPPHAPPHRLHINACISTLSLRY